MREKVELRSAIVLCAGSMNYSDVPIGTSRSNAMIPINGRPVIGWILDDLISKGIGRVRIVLRQGDQRLQDFLVRAFDRRIDLQLVLVEHGGTILHSLAAGLESVSHRESVSIVLGDTLIRDAFTESEDFVYVSEVDDPERWCFVEIDAEGHVVNFMDKPKAKPAGWSALAGFYQLADGEFFRECVLTALEADENEISKALSRYCRVRPIRAYTVNQWFDFGHIDRLVDARRRLLQPRHFNTLVVDPVTSTITKTSLDQTKLSDELNWYLSLPDPVKVLTPRIVSHRSEGGKLAIEQEFYGYPTLAELFVYSDLTLSTWVSILRQVLRVHERMRRHAGTFAADGLEDVLERKTWRRLEQWGGSETSAAVLLDQRQVVVNGQSLLGIAALRPKITERVFAMQATSTGTLLHGDYCFSNILYDVTSQTLRLIDPRGNFGGVGIYGDPRYDIAKLRHSVCGLYDYIIADLFALERTREGEFSTAVFANEIAQPLRGSFDDMLIRDGWDLDDIRFIEGLLFVSMPPLHRGHVARQEMMFLTGLRLLNEALL